MSKTTKVMKLLADLSPEEINEILNEYKDTSGNQEPQAQNDLKETDKVGSSETPQEKAETPQSVETKGVEQEQVSTEEKESPIEETQTTQENQTETNSVDGGVVGNEIDNDPKYEAVEIKDFVLKTDLEEYLKSFESKLNALVDENKALKEKLDETSKENTNLKDKYEGDSFGAFQQRFGAKQSANEKTPYKDFDTMYGELKEKLKF